MKDVDENLQGSSGSRLRRLTPPARGGKGAASAAEVAYLANISAAISGVLQSRMLSNGLAFAAKD